VKARLAPASVNKVPSRHIMQ